MKILGTFQMLYQLSTDRICLHGEKSQQNYAKAGKKDGYSVKSTRLPHPSLVWAGYI